MKKQNRRLIYSKDPLRLTSLGKEIEGEMLMDLESRIIKPLRRHGFSDDGIIQILKSAVKSLPAWLEEEEIHV